MLSDKLLIFLLVVNLAILIVSIVERNLVKTLYWLGAILLQTSVLIGMGGKIK